MHRPFHTTVLLAAAVLVATLSVGAGAVAVADEATAPALSESPLAPAAPAAPAAPTGNVFLPLFVNSADVALQVAVTGAPPLQWRAANAAAPWSEWADLPLADGSGVSGVPWTLPAGDGFKTVAVEVRDAALEVTAFTATTTLDTQAPVLLSTEPAGGAALAAPPAAIVFHYDEPLPADLHPGIDIVATPPWPALHPFPIPVVDGQDVRVVDPWMWSPHTTYAVTITGVVDRAGNAAADANPTFSVDRLTTSVKLSMSATTITYGSPVKLKGKALIHGYPAVGGSVLSVARQVAGETGYTGLGTVTVRADRTFLRNLTPAAGASYLVTFPDGPDYIGASDTLDVTVRPRLTMTATTEIWLGGTVVFKGGVAPAHPGTTVVIQRRIDDVWTDWRTVKLNSESRFSMRWHPGAANISRFRLTSAADGLHASARTGVRRVVVNRPNPHHVPMLYRNFLVIDISQCHLYYYRYGRVVRVFDVVLGKPSTPTPTGQWSVWAKQPHPGGPFGAYVLWYHAGYGIHGTNEEYLLRLWPRYFSHGCCRLYNSAITWLYPRIPIGTPVRNVY